MRIIFGLLMVAFFWGGQAVAQDSACDGQIGAAYGLCNAYCEAMDCDSDEVQASATACEKVSVDYSKITGELMPCEVVECPCWTAEQLAVIDGFHEGATLYTTAYTQTDEYPDRPPKTIAQCGEDGYDNADVYIWNQVGTIENIYPPNVNGDSYCMSYTREGTNVIDDVHLWYSADGGELTLAQLRACTAQVMECIDLNTP